MPALVFLVSTYSPFLKEQYSYSNLQQCLRIVVTIYSDIHDIMVFKKHRRSAVVSGLTYPSDKKRNRLSARVIILCNSPYSDEVVGGLKVYVKIMSLQKSFHRQSPLKNNSPVSSPSKEFASPSPATPNSQSAALALCMLKVRLIFLHCLLMLLN